MTPKFAVVNDQDRRPAPPDRHRGQRRFAERFVHVHGGRFLFVHGIGWHEFTGARWEPCQDGAEVRAMCEVVSAALDDLRALDDQSRKELVKDISAMDSNAGVTGALALASAMEPCTLAGHLLDRDAHLINTASGTVDLRLGELRDADPDDRLSKMTAAKFDPAARSEVFDEFLSTIQPDPDMRAFLARSLGSALLGRVVEHVLLIWFGTGANGKGTLRDAVRHALGDYGIEVPAEVLLQSRHGQQALAPERMRLRGARAAFCSEIAAGARLDEATMKKLTGGDPVNAKLLYRNPVEFDPSHTLFMLTNHLPVVHGDDPAVWRRILAVPFDTVVPVEKRDGHLPERLRECPDAVLAWLWAGWLDYAENGLNPPDAVTEATQKYRLDSDVLARFLADDGAVVQGHGSVGSAELYSAFKAWGRAEGEEIEQSNKAFTEAMELRGYRRKRGSGGWRWSGLMIASKDGQDHD